MGNSLRIDGVWMAQVEIYTTRYCPFCHSAKALLNRKGVVFVEIDVTGDPQGRAKMVERANGRSAVPQIFIGSTHVGGRDELYELNLDGGLDALLAAEGVVPAPTQQGQQEQSA
jgi:glutaredoxin 3